MNKSKTMVSSFMSRSPVYVKDTDFVSKALEEIQKFKIETISVINQDFSIIGCITRKQIDNILKLQAKTRAIEKLKVKDVITKNRFPVILYPHIDIDNAFSLMKCLNNICAPVAECPWDKKMIGVLWLTDNK